MQRPELSLANENLNGLPPDDPDLERDRQENDNILKSAWETIFDKYERDFADIGDEIDLETGEIVVDNGHIHQMRDDTDVGGNEVSQMMRYFTKRAEEEENEEGTESASSGYDEDMTSSQDGSVSFENEREFEIQQESTMPITSSRDGRRGSRPEVGSHTLVLVSEEDEGNGAPVLAQEPSQGQSPRNATDFHGLHHNPAPSGSLQPLVPSPPEAYAAALQNFSQSIANQITTFMTQWMGVVQSNDGALQAPNFAASIGQALSAPPIQPPASTMQAPQNAWAFPALPEDSQPMAPSRKKKRGYKETVERSPKRKSLWAQDSSGNESESTDDEPPPIRRRTNRHDPMRHSNRDTTFQRRPPQRQSRDSEALSHRPVEDLAEASDQPDDEMEEYEAEIDQMDFSNMVSRLYVRPVWQRFKRRDGKLIRILIEKFGKGWSAIMPYFPGRKEAHVQYFYYKYLHETKGVTKRPYTQAVTGRAAMMRYAREGIIPPTRSLAHRAPLPRRGNPSLEELQALSARLDKNPMKFTDEELEKYRGPYPPKSANQHVHQYNKFRVPRINAVGFGSPQNNIPRPNSDMLSSPIVDPALLEPDIPSSTGLGRHKFRSAPAANPGEPPTIELWSSKSRKSHARQTYGDANSRLERSSEANPVYGSTPSRLPPVPATPRNHDPRISTTHQIFQTSSTRRTPIRSFAYNPGRKQETQDDHDDSSDSAAPIMLWGRKKQQTTPTKSPATRINPLLSPVDGLALQAQDTEIPRSTDQTSTTKNGNTRNRSERPTTPPSSDHPSHKHQRDELVDNDDRSRPASVRHNRTPQQGFVLTTPNKSQGAELPDKSRSTKSNHSHKSPGLHSSTSRHAISRHVSRNTPGLRYISNIDGTDEARDASMTDSPKPRNSHDQKENSKDVGHNQEDTGNVSILSANGSDTGLVSNDNTTVSPTKNQEADSSTMPSSPPSPLLANQTAYLANKLATASQKRVPRTPTSKLHERSTPARGSARHSASTSTPKSTRAKSIAQSKENQVAEGESEDELALW